MPFTDTHERLELCSRVTDICRRRVVIAPKGCRYVALSYVGEAETLHDLRQRR